MFQSRGHLVKSESQRVDDKPSLVAVDLVEFPGLQHCDVRSYKYAVVGVFQDGADTRYREPVVVKEGGFARIVERHRSALIKIRNDLEPSVPQTGSIDTTVLRNARP